MNKKTIFLNKLCIIFIIALLLLNIFINNSVFGATYDLSDYKNQELIGGKFVIIYSLDNDKIYLLTVERADYPYIYTNQHADSKDDKVYSSGGWICSYSAGFNGNAQGHIKYYTYNTETSKFENRQHGGIGNGAFNPRKE